MVIDLHAYAHCAPDIAIETIAAIVTVESNGNPLAININGSSKQLNPTTKKDAITQAYGALRWAKSIDLGLMQVNSANLKRLNYTVEDMFDPCANIKAGASILKEAYILTSRQLGPGQEALTHALSIYNTGNMRSGFKNGYVERYTSPAFKRKVSHLLSWNAPVLEHFSMLEHNRILRAKLEQKEEHDG